MATTTWYRQALLQMMGSGVAGGAPNVDFLSDTIHAALVGAAYTPNYDTHVFWSDVVANEVANGGGYVTNGALLGTKTATYVAANSWANVWAVATAFQAGDIVRPAAGNGYIYRAQAAGTSHASVTPTWPTVLGATVVDNTVTWTCIGKGAVTIDAADPSWASSTITAAFLVVYDRTPATDATRPLLCCVDFAGAKTTTNGTFQVTFNASGMLVLPMG